MSISSRPQALTPAVERPTARPAAARTAIVLIGIFLLALTLRGVWIARTDTGLPWLSDPQYYHATAQNIAEGRGYSVTMGDAGFTAGPASEATAFWAPGYPIALSPFYKLFGSDIRVGKLFNALVGALTVFPVFFLARRSRPRLRRRDGDDDAPSDGLGLLAAGIFAVIPSLVFWTPTLFSEPLFTLGVALTLAVSLWAGDRRHLAAYLVAGLTLSATAFVRSQGMLLIVPVAVLIVRQADVRTLVRAGAGVGLGIVMLVVPWAARNQVAMGHAYLINDNLGYNLRISHAPYSTGTSVPPQDIWDDDPGISFKQREVLFDEEGRHRALEYARSHPARELQLAGLRLSYLLRSDAGPALRESLGPTTTPSAARSLLTHASDAFYYLLVALTVLSLFALRPTRVSLALWSTIAVWLGLHLVFAGEPRYHVPLAPVAAMLAAGTIVALWSALRQRLPARWGGALPSLDPPPSIDR